MDIIKELASKTELTSQDELLLPSLSFHDTQDWVKSLDENSPLNNLDLLLHLHDKDLLQITTYVHFCSNLINFTDLLCCYVTSSNEHELSIGSDVVCILLCVQDSVVCYDKCRTVLTQLVKYLANSLTSTNYSDENNSSNSLPLLVDHLNQSEHRIQFIVNQFLTNIITETLSPEEGLSLNSGLAEVVAQQKTRFPGLKEQALYRFLQRVSVELLFF
uniref:Uncharacterized protein n=1 Tax=Cacopsylla melanoneura TaxID=428564 RepID=A0A8D8QNZ5_9HEMI